jgi:hypothetical protein
LQSEGPLLPGPDASYLGQHNLVQDILVQENLEQ